MNLMELERRLKNLDPDARFVIASIHERQTALEKQLNDLASALVTLASTIETLAGTTLNLEQQFNRKRERDAQVESIPVLNDPQEQN